MPSGVLILIDNRPLQRAAWAELHAVRKRLEKAARDLHRHEDADSLAYQRWLHSTFPQLITTLRDLHQDVATKSYHVQTVQMWGAQSGRSLKKLWREYQEELANPPPDDPEPDPRDADDNSSDATDADSFFKDLFGDHDPADSCNAEPIHTPAPSAPPASTEARDLYRRLVQHLHPDRGGEWTPARERLWHEVQAAWAARDADWLARLEIDWETANDTLHPDSAISRLHRAIHELHAARRDTERKLRRYRGSFAWRFTLAENKRPQLHPRVEASLRDELTALQRQQTYLNATIAAWESPKARPRR